MGPRIREEKEGDGGILGKGRLAVGRRSTRGVGSPREQRRRGHGDGSPHPRGHGRVHPHPNLPPEGGRERGEGVGGWVALREGRLLNTMALNIPKFRSFEVIRRWLL